MSKKKSKDQEPQNEPTEVESTGLSEILGGDEEIPESIREEYAAQEEGSRLQVGQEPEPEPEPERTAAQDQEAEPEQEVEGDEDELDLDALDPKTRRYVQELRTQSDGRLKALERHRERLREVEADRRDMMRAVVTLNERTRQQKTGEEEAEPEQRTIQGMRVVEDEDGNLSIPPEEFDRMLKRAREPEIRQNETERQRMAAVTDLVREAPQPVQERLRSAYVDFVQTLQGEVQRSEAPPRNVGEALALMDATGKRTELERKHGVALEDLVDLEYGARDPWNEGYRMRRVVSTYQQRWGTNGSGGEGGEKKHPSDPPRPISQSRPPTMRSTSGRSDDADSGGDPLDNSITDLVHMSDDELEGKLKDWERRLGGDGRGRYLR